ncbi:PHD finger protein-related [Zea mays]|uniref:PHD finger protein-related n=1 Tax=Zea mays TaxID=4577 RepID=A0A1D6LTE9_MAIZE|nr:PHD finger protein-related [Zea mays]
MADTGRDAFPDEAEPAFTLDEYMEDIEAVELEADLVLGGDEGKECTYAGGYLKRQAVFSCLTCVPDGVAGVCTACSLACHDGHEIPRDEEGEPLYEELICHKCSSVCHFLKLYPDTIWASGKPNLAVETDASDSNVMKKPSGHADPEKHENGALVDNTVGEKTSVENDSTKAIAVPEEANLGSSSGNNCKLGVDVNTMPAITDKSEPFFMSKGWRETLCRCETCFNFYAQRGIAYLIDKEDSIEEYEKIAKQKREMKLEQQQGAETNFLNSLNHVQKIEMISGINDMKNEFQSFLVTIFSYFIDE